MYHDERHGHQLLRKILSLPTPKITEDGESSTAPVVLLWHEGDRAVIVRFEPDTNLETRLYQRRARGYDRACQSRIWWNDVDVTADAWK